MAKSQNNQTKFARKLRRHSTAAERKAWDLVRNRRMLGLKFRRQHVLGSFVVDFYCHELRLVLEVDGSIHSTPKQAKWDRERDEILRGAGFRVVRIPNEEVSAEGLEAIVQSLRHKNSP